MCISLKGVHELDGFNLKKKLCISMDSLPCVSSESMILPGSSSSFCLGPVGGVESSKAVWESFNAMPVGTRGGSGVDVGGGRGLQGKDLIEDSKGPRDGVGRSVVRAPEKDGKICREAGLGVMGALGFKNRRSLWVFRESHGWASSQSQAITPECQAHKAINQVPCPPLSLGPVQVPGTL